MNLVCDKFDKLFVNNKTNYALGSWCLNNSLKKNFNVSFNNYENESFEKINKNHLLSKKLEIKILNTVSKELNIIHNVNFSRRYWQILIGPWLERALKFLLFRFNNIKKVEKKISSIVKLNDKGSHLNCDNLIEAIYLHYNLVKSNNLDNAILSYLSPKVRIIKKNYKSKFLYLPKDNYTKNINTNINFSNKVPIICETPLSILERSLIYLKLGFLPRFWAFPKEIKTKTDITFRKQLVDKFFKKSINDKNFEFFFNKIFYEIIPTCYLEGYRENRKLSNNIGLPSNPYFIFTMSGYSFSEIFRFYKAEVSEKNIPIISFQHGCNYGTSKFIANSSIEEKYSNKFLTFGWKEKKNDNPMFLYQKKLRQSEKIKEKILIIMDGIASENHPYNVYIKNELYKKNMAMFFNEIKIQLKSKLILKLHTRSDPINQENDKFWKQLKFINRKKIQIKKEQNILSLRKISKFNIHTYEGTSFYEDIANNIPCIMILKDGLKFIRPSAKPLFKLMMEKGIIYEDYKKAAHQVNTLYDQIDEWWNSKDIKDLVEKFRKKYARKEPLPVRKIVNFLKKL